MSYGGYQQYGGNPYGESAQGGYGSSNPYLSDVEQGHGGNQYGRPQEQLSHENSNYSQPSGFGYDAPQPEQPILPQPSQPMSTNDFLARVEGTKSRIAQLSSNIAAIASIHQRLLNSPETSGSTQLENLVTQTQILNTGIKDEIKFLEKDAARSGETNYKNVQIKNLKSSFEAQLRSFQEEERDYSRRYRDAIARQYRIVNPDATEDEVQEASNANWGDEGVFQTALKSNRSGQATSVLGAVRARHNDIMQIEKTLGDLAVLFEQLNEAVVYDEPKVEGIENHTGNVRDDTEQANKQLDKGIEHAKRARRLKWWTLLTVLAICAILALVLGLYFGLHNNGGGNKNGS